MESNSSSNTLLSLQGASIPEIEAPSRFARALKQARFARGWTQAKLSAQLGIPKRAIVSWETATRLPSIGMVILLIDGLTKEKFSFSHELLSAYALDDLERLEKDDQKADRLLSHAHHAILQVEEITHSQPHFRQTTQIHDPQALKSTNKEPDTPASVPADSPSLEPLFALLNQLQQHPDLIPVANDFLRELAPGEPGTTRI